MALHKNIQTVCIDEAVGRRVARLSGLSLTGSIGLAAGFSFYPNKNLGAFGSGGMVVTNNLAIADKIHSLRNYGAPRKYFHSELGTNSRLDTLQAAILNIKLPYLFEWNLTINKATQVYGLALQPLETQQVVPIKNYSQFCHVYHLYVMESLVFLLLLILVGASGKNGKYCPIKVIF
ncbi:DegT/DnrJ/EryC1/StrS aminotransferase family protein [Stanieria sp. NIES-3757]|nr:DegT/DnrJ/EryC1/StrS aminotransferase family protein [Stanieria sp. NIES-3757]